jgi:hypothetical protein
MNRELDNHEMRMAYAKIIAYINQKYQDLHEGLQLPSEFISFEFQGSIIHNPFIDISGSYNVNPIREYGANFVNSQFYNPTYKLG